MPNGRYPLADLSRPSPNFGSRLSVPLTTIVLHETDSATAESALSWFENPESQVSAHYVVDKDGHVYSCVPDYMSAWHCAGVNRMSIGIECVAKDGDQLAAAQEQALIALIKWLMAAYNINWTNITGHRFAVSTTKACPGALFGERTLTALKEWSFKHFGSQPANTVAS